MLGVLFLIFIYRYYANLAKQYAKIKWHYGLLGVVIFMAVQMTVGGVYGIYLAIAEPVNWRMKVPLLELHRLI